MRRNQIIVVSFCAVLLVGLYLFGKTKKPKEDNKASMADTGGHAQQAPESLNIEEYIASVNAQVSDKSTRENLQRLTESKSYKQLIAEYQKLDKPLAIAYYAVKNAESENKATSYMAAGEYNGVLLQSAPDEKSQRYLSNNAIQCYKKAVELDTANTEYKISLAGAYMEEGSQPMQGVSMLLEIVRKDSNNVNAQLMLGRFGLISGQLDKAIARFEKILYLQPQNSEALYLDAQAFNAKGDKKKAAELLERCKKAVQDPAAKKKIEEEIRALKTKGS